MIDRQFSTLVMSDTADVRYAALVAALGYESRAVAISEHLNRCAELKFAFGFDHNHVLAYGQNKEWLVAHKFEIKDDVSDEDFERELPKCLDAALKSNLDRGRILSIGVDISCFNRQRLAALIHRLGIASLNSSISVDFWYCIGAFSSPSADRVPNEIVGPIHDKFAGWFTDPGKPLALVAGLGYEPGKVLGAMEYLQASRTIAFFPKSPIPQYEPEVRSANQEVLEELAAHDLIEYRVDDPKRTLASLDSVIRGLSTEFNVVLLPLGPKIFVLTSLLVSLLHTDVSVWRVSLGSGIQPRDIQPSKEIFGLRVVFDRSLVRSTEMVIAAQ